VGRDAFVEIAVDTVPLDMITNRAGTRAYVSSLLKGTVSIIDPASNKVTKVVPLAPNNAYRLLLSSDESRLFVTSMDGNLYTLNTGSQTAGASQHLIGVLQGLVSDKAGRSLFVSATSGMIWRLDASTLSPVDSVALNCTAQDLALSGDDAELYVACENATLTVLDAATLATKTTISIPSSDPFGLAVTPDGTQLYVTSPHAGSLTIIDLQSRTIVQTIALTGGPRRVRFNTHGNIAYIVYEGNWVDVIR
jgi:YVTN family beta-propeller protein